MIAFPNAKINLGLNIIEKRQDGYHNIQSCFVPIEWFDILEAVEADQFNFSTSGLPIPGNADSNLCVTAYELLKVDYNLPAVAIHLHKNIPIGAGLGGGSADGAFMLKLLNDKFELGLSYNQLETYAAKLGSDCPFFIRNEPTYVEGTGAEFSPINIDLAGLHMVVVYPELHISTQDAYAHITPRLPKENLKKVLESKASDQWQSLVHNDFEPSLLESYPEIAQLKEKMAKNGAVYSSMTGSGSAVFGLFKESPEITFAEPGVRFQIGK